MDLCAFTHEQPRTRRCTIHPCALTTTLTKNNKSRQFRAHLDQSRNCLYPFPLSKGMGRGSFWSSLDLETLESDVSSGKSAGAIAKDRGWAKQQRSSTCCGPRPKRSCSTLCQWCCKAFDAKALGRDLRVHRGGTWANFSEDCSKSLHIVSNLQSKGSPFAALLQDRHIRDRRNVAEDMLARLALASGRRISRKLHRAVRLNLDVICFSDEKIFKVDAGCFQATVFTHFLGGENGAASLFGIHHAKTGGSQMLRRNMFVPLFRTYRSQVGCTSTWTLLAAMLRGLLSPELSPNERAVGGIFERKRRCHRLCHLVLSPTDMSFP